VPDTMAGKTGFDSGVHGHLRLNTRLLEKLLAEDRTIQRRRTISDGNITAQGRSISCRLRLSVPGCEDARAELLARRRHARRYYEANIELVHVRACSSIFTMRIGLFGPTRCISPAAKFISDEDGRRAWAIIPWSWAAHHLRRIVRGVASFLGCAASMKPLAHRALGHSAARGDRQWLQP